MSQAALAALYSVIVGFCLGGVYDFVRFFRLLFGFTVASPFGKKGITPYVGWLFVVVTDLFFMLFAAACMAVFFFLTGDGRMRSYGLLGAFLGFKLYYHTLGKLFIRIAEALIKRLRRIMAKFTESILKTPIVRRFASWYNDYRKKKTVAKRKKRQKRNVVRNGF